ncbi:ROK family protein [Listeria grayi]|uniref:ROK family protein n=1 Tax=Listeria grayi TaxID=1641 RepID=UPI001625BCF4|nr:ROK family protein [Listeria grayi]MBC1922775.1 ROK family protein [Listeria grayi]
MGIIAFDIGGSAVKYGVYEADELQAKGKFTTPKDWETMLTQLEGVCAQMRVDFTLTGAAFSVPGAVDQSRGRIDGISAVPYIHEVAFEQILQTRLGMPISLENDANCAALAEVWLGAAKDNQNVLVVVAGSGIGGGVIIDRQLQRGAHLYGGEFGIMVLDRGKTFSELGTPVAMARRYSIAMGKTYSGEEVFALAEAGEESAKAEVEKFYHFLTLGLYNLQFMLDPEKIILGGGVTAKAGLKQEINRRMRLFCEAMKLTDFDPIIEICHFKNDANLIGAVANFLEKQKKYSNA